VLRPDNKIVVVGAFDYFNDISRNSVALLNADGSLDTSLDPGLGADNTIRCVALQPDGKIIIAGDFTSYNGAARNRIARINADGSLDNTFNPGPGPNNSIRSLIVQPDGKIIIGGLFTNYNGTSRNYIARLNAAGSLDTEFNPGTGANDWVMGMTLQSDGKILIGGWFTLFNGVAHNAIARLNTNGSLDATFNTGTALSGASYALVNAILLQPDGKMIVGGNFTTNGTLHKAITRLNADGTPETTFDPGEGANSAILALAFQQEGNIIVGGNFTTFNGFTRFFIGQIEVTGTIDPDFGPGKGVFDGFVNAFAIQPDNKIILGGTFGSYNGVLRNRIARTHPDGSIDTAFNPGTGTGGDYNSIECVALQPDGKVIIGGFFTSFNGTNRKNIARLNADGSLDAAFNPGVGPVGDGSSILAMAIQPDGKIVLAGQFMDYNSTGMKKIVRLNADGSLDATFNSSESFTDASDYEVINTIALQPDGKIIVGGFLKTSDQESDGLARLNTDGSIDTTFVSGTGAAIKSLLLQPDGKIIIAGNFGYYNGIQSLYIARINTDGSLDTSFSSGQGAPYGIQSIALQPNGKIIIAGLFSVYDGVQRPHIARINTDGTIDSTFAPSQGVVYTYTDGAAVYDVALQSDGQILIGGIFNKYDDVFRNRVARVHGGEICNTPLPQGAATQSVSVNNSANATIWNLIVTGTDIKWYDAEGNIIPTNTILVNGTTYYVTQTIDCESEPLAITVQVVLGAESFIENRFTYYPNPVADRLNVVSGTVINLIEVYTLVGQKVIERSFNTTEAAFDIGKLARGSYLVRAYTANGLKSFIILKDK